MEDLTFTDNVGPLDFLASLPKKALNWSTRDLLETPSCAGGDFLKLATSNGFWHICSNEDSDKAITEADIFDFLFGAYQNGDCERKLALKGPSITAKFLENLWQVSHFPLSFSYSKRNCLKQVFFLDRSEVPTQAYGVPEDYLT